MLTKKSKKGFEATWRNKTVDDRCLHSKVRVPSLVSHFACMISSAAKHIIYYEDNYLAHLNLE